jgi:hypothetical protein
VRLYRPTPPQIYVLIGIGFLSVGYGMYLRYLAFENDAVSRACRDGARTWLCSTFQLVNMLYEHTVIGWVALALAVIQLLRPTLIVFALGLATAGFGLVLYNAQLSALATALLVLSFARRAPSADIP